MAITIKGKEYVVRDLTNDDLFNFLEITDKIDVSFIDDLVKNIKKPKKGEELIDVQKVLGAKTAFLLLRQLHKAKHETYNFLGGLIDMPPHEFAKVSPQDTFKVINEVLKKEGAVNFFSSALNTEE